MQDLGTGPVYLDTSPFIYLIEEHPRFLRVVQPVFSALDAGTLSGITSMLTLTEILVQPYRAGMTDLAQTYETLFTRCRGLKLVEITLSVARLAARLRAEYAIKTPDALQLATALVSQCSAFLTNDRKLPAVGNIGILQVGTYLN